jgi:zinc transporter ZupT
MPGPGKHHLMLTTLLYAAGASLPLAAGALGGVLWEPPKRLVAAALAFAAGALIVSTSFELFEPAFEDGGPWRSAISFALGASSSSWPTPHCRSRDRGGSHAVARGPALLALPPTKPPERAASPHSGPVRSR